MTDIGACEDRERPSQLQLQQRQPTPKITVPMIYRSESTGRETPIAAEIDLGLYLALLR